MFFTAHPKLANQVGFLLSMQIQIQQFNPGIGCWTVQRLKTLSWPYAIVLGLGESYHKKAEDIGKAYNADIYRDDAVITQPPPVQHVLAVLTSLSVPK